MEQIVLKVHSGLAGKMKLLINVFGNNDLFVDRFIDFHINRLKREITKMQIELDKYETKYKIESAEFYKRFEQGEFGDEKDFMLWSGIYELMADSKKKLSKMI